jgi:hypothetical protein
VRVVISAILLLVVCKAHSQVPAQHIKFVDSVENSVNTNLKKFLLKKDTGRIVGVKNQTASYQKQYYIDRTTRALCFATYLTRYNNGTLINDTYYYVLNKPISGYRIRQVKRKPLEEEAYYFYNDRTYKQNDTTILAPDNEMRRNAESLLAQCKKGK